MNSDTRCENQPYYRAKRSGPLCIGRMTISGFPVWCAGVILPPIPWGSTTQSGVNFALCTVERGAKDALLPSASGATPWYMTGWGRWSIASQRWSDIHGWNEANKWDHAMGMWRAAQLASPTSSTQACGRTTIETGAKLVKGRGVFGARTCGSPWSCPHCSARVARERQGELARIADAASRVGLKARLVLLTIKHSRDDDLGELTDRLLTAWRGMVGTGAARARNKRLGVVSAVRGLEVTHGVNGWHPHIHAVVWFVDDGSAKHAESAWREAWEAQVGPVSSGAWGWQKPKSDEAAARYAAKAGAAGLEVGAGQTHSTAVWAILERLANSGVPEYRDWSLWQTYAEGMKGRRALGWFAKKRVASLVKEREELEELEEEDELELSQAWLSYLWTHALLGAVLAGASNAWQSWGVLARCMAEAERPEAVGGPMALAWDMGISAAELAGLIRWGKAKDLPF